MENRNKRKIGAEYEKRAGHFLEAQGYQIVTYNYRCRRGEIDVIAWDREYLVFCEVKYRSDKRSGHPLEAVDMKKQKVISKCAAHYILENHLQEVPCRFDVVGVMGEEIFVVQNAFDYRGETL